MKDVYDWYCKVMMKRVDLVTILAVEFAKKSVLKGL